MLRPPSEVFEGQNDMVFLGQEDVGCAMDPYHLKRLIVQLDGRAIVMSAKRDSPS